MTLQCLFGHDWRYYDPFQSGFQWVTPTSASPIYWKWYQDSKCSRCGKERTETVYVVETARRLARTRPVASAADSVQAPS